MHLNLPFTDPVLIVALSMALFLVVPLVFERLRIPGIIGLILAGTLVGPNGLALMARDQTIVLLGTVGLLYLMFLVGLELDLVDFAKYRNHSITFGGLSFLIPQLVGTGVGFLFGYSLASSLLLGAVCASHTVLAYPIASRLGIVKNPAVTTTLGGTILTEVLALLVLAVIVGSAGGDIGPRFWAILLGSLALYVGLVLWGVPKLGRWFFRKVSDEGVAEFVFVMATVFVVAYAAHAAHVEPIIGALLAGLALNRLIPQSGTLMNRIHFMGEALFIPFFLLSVGMLVDVRALVSVDALAFSLVLAAAVVISKWLASRLTQGIFGYNSEEGWTIFGLSVPHASGTLAIVLVGFQVEFFDQNEVNGVVLTILLTSLLGPWLVEKYGRRVAAQEEQKEYEPSEAPQRIMIPVSNPATAEALIDLAMVMRRNDEPLYPLMVVRENGGDTEAQVAEAEKMLGHAVIYAAGADIPVSPLTRVDTQIAHGIARGITDTRTTVVIVGWDAGRSRRTGIFGSVLDRLLEQTRQMVVVTKLGHPLNTTSRLILVFPPLIGRHPGFPDVMRAFKTVASQLGASIHALVIGGDPARFEHYLDGIRPTVPATFQRLEGWGELLPTLREEVRPDDLVVVTSARRGTLAWQPRLERLPRQLASLAPESFILAYPPELDRAENTRAPVLPGMTGVAPERVVRLEAQDYEAALETMLRGAVQDPATVGAITAGLVRGEREFSSEILPGVVLPHVRVRGLKEPLLLLGISAKGIRFPKAQHPARLIFVLVSPASRPEQHLRQLAQIARFVGNREHMAELLQDHAPEAPVDWLAPAEV